MADYRNYVIQAARPARASGPRKTSSIHVLQKDERGHTLLKKFRFAVDSDESLQRAIQRAKNYVDFVADRELTEAARQSARKS